MSVASRRAEFFALEAREYLAELEPLAQAREAPDAERLVRGARALRGAALMAGLGTFARAAAGLEGVARQVRDHALAWEPDARAAWREGLETLRGLVARATTWEAADDRQSLALAERLDRVAGGLSATSPVPAAPTLTPGVRAFIARESALIAGSLEQAARALAPMPPPAALAAVLERMQSLRGLNASVGLSPLPELLDAMEVATRTLLSDVPPPPDVATVFADAAHALAAMARAVSDTGRVAPLPEVDRLAARLLDSYANERDVAPIGSLAPDGFESIVRRGAPPPLPQGAPVPVELVGVGDHLLLTADALERAASTAVRDLGLFVLHRTLATMPARSPTGGFLAPLAEAVTTAIGDGIAARDLGAFVRMLRESGRFLVESASQPDQAALAARRDQLAARLITIELGPAPEAAPRAAVSPVPDTVVPIEALGYDEPVDDAVIPIAALAFDPEPAEAVVPIASLAYDTAAPDDADVVPIASLDYDASDVETGEIVPIESLAPDPPPLPEIPAVAPGAPTRLERAFARAMTLAREAPRSDPSLSGLIAMQIVPVDTLLYRGSGALARANELRSEIVALLEGPGIALDQLRPYIQELLDLVPLARDAA